MSKRSRSQTVKTDAPKAEHSITQMWSKAKQKKEIAAATEGVSAIKEHTRDDSHVLKQYNENVLTAFTDAQKGGDVEDIQEDQRKLVDGISSLLLREGGGLPSKKLFSSLLLCIMENRSAILSIHTYELLKRLQQRFPATELLPGQKVGQTLPYLQVDKEVWTPLDALRSSVPLRGSAAAATVLSPPRAGAKPRENDDGTVGRPGDFFEVLSHVVKDLWGESEVPEVGSAPAQRGRRGKKAMDGAEMDEAAKQQARVRAAEALAVQRLGTSLMFKYLVALLYDDLSCRLAVYRAHNCGNDFKRLVESLLYRLLVNHTNTQKRNQVLANIFAVIQAASPERAEEAPEPSTAPSKSRGTDDMDVDVNEEGTSGTPASKKGKGKKGKGRRSSTVSVSMRGEEASTSTVTQIEVESPFDAAFEKRKDDLAAEHALSCSRQDLCTSAQTLLASILELTAVMENNVNMWKANDIRKEVLDKMVSEFCPNKAWDSRLDTQRHFLETMLSPEHKLRFILEYYLAICPKGSEAVQVLQRKGRKATACDLLTALRENVKKLLSSQLSTPDEVALLTAHAVQADYFLGTANLKQLQQELDEMWTAFKDALPSSERKGLHLSASANAALIAASTAIKVAATK